MTTTIVPGTGTATPPAHARPRASGPWPARAALGAIMALATVLYGWGVWSQSGNSYYAAAVLSGTKSWKAFFYGSLDAGNYITVDKPPLALWTQELVARVIGVNGWSLVGPSVVMGVAAVAVLYATVRRAFGTTAALIAALVLALTPITVAIDRDNNPDTLLVLLLVLGAWALQRAVESGRLRWLAACALLVGLGFNTKMMQAFLVLPAFALVYLLCAPGGRLRRVRHLAVAGGVLAVASAWWMLIVDAVPASSRPYVGGSTDGSVWDLVIGYNGLGRIFGENGGGGGGGQGGGFGGAAGIGRLFNDTMGGQISWLLPFAAIALVTGLVLRGRRPRTDLKRAALLLWGGWLAVHFAVFSLSEGTFHPYYTTAMAPAIAALAGAGCVTMFGAPRRMSWTLPFAVAVTAGWAFFLLRRTPSWHPWLPWTVAALAAVAVIGLDLRRAPRRLAVAAAEIGLVAVLAGPAAYAASAASSGADNGSNPTAGPAAQGGMGGFGHGAPTGGGPGSSGQKGRFQTPPSGQSGQPSGRGGEVSSQLVSYLEKNQGDATWLVAVSSAQNASSIILRTGRPVIAMGGFTGSDPAMTVAKLQRYVQEGKLKYVMLGGGGPGGGSANSAVTAWIKQHGTVVSASEYGGTSGSGTLYKLSK
ncbi:glycosyltransferase family 39 protein [Actinomadura montaniterrae]|uniref:Glycosyl transferase family 39 n=1 Tax=Actinomadura montaniterrae TaxID=1803903 RepID=A0A6L3W0H5_9ACTN|nr:glycosyltransferase family 39 protein [Actinomadura montaniterrae]KAB2379478.1 glycosyl transferase family 39 [Actinomadura montaniterrae]